jgi:hypothetical protein
MHVPIDKFGAWGYFHGSSQGTPPSGEGKGIIFLVETHLFKFNVGLGGGSNNFAELLALKLLL